ncbi:MAG: hypothetical protein EAX95_15300, partial [Candidatus Thorarchaeota archaeon]|nr:hypothetical protein [Candidatus Thorarchaeota archaeon]
MGFPDDDLAERFRRVARNNRVTLPSLQEPSPANELDELQAGLNKAVYPSSESWMLPAWAARQLAVTRASSSTEDTLYNNTSRNWVTVGGVGSSHYAIMDETGLATAFRQCGYIDFWFDHKESIVFPALVDRDVSRIELYSPDDQLFEWKKFLGAIEVTRQVYHGETGECEALYNEIHIKNHSLEDTEFVFYAVIRPASVRGVEPIETLEYNDARKMVISNGYVALISDKPPTSIVLSAADNPNLIAAIRGSAERRDTEFSTAKGLATAILKYRIRLAPAESKRYFYVSPLSGMTGKDEIPFEFHTSIRDEYVGKWFDFSERTTSFAFPESTLDAAVLQAKAVLAQQVYSRLDSGITSTSSTEPAEWARVFSALCRSGCLELARDLALKGIRRWFSDGQGAPSDAANPLVWGVLQYYHYSQDETYLKTIGPLLGAHFSKMQSAVEAKMKPSRKYMTGEETSHIPQEHPGAPEESPEVEGEFLGVDEILAATAKIREGEDLETARPPVVPRTGLRNIVSSVWDLAALKAGVSALRALGMNNLADTLQNLHTSYSEWLMSTSEEVHDGIVDQADDPELSIASLDLLATIALLGKAGVSSNLEQWSLNTTLDNLMRRNLVMIPGSERQFSSHLGLRLAHYYVFTLRDYETWNLLRRAIELLSEYHTFPEFVDPHSGAGRSGDGCSMLAAADLLILLREMIVS